jgi:ubiquinone/menaquinone biosynthesis C-methylase UbiE
VVALACELEMELSNCRMKNLESFFQTLEEAFRCLKPGGKILCLGPNIKFVNGPYWDYWDHYIPITEESLAETLSLRGFDVQCKIDKFLFR